MAEFGDIPKSTRRPKEIKSRAQIPLRLEFEKPTVPQAPREWETLVLNEGTDHEIPLKGLHYDIPEDSTPLFAWSLPPRTGRGQRLGAINGARVFVVKDSEKSSDRFRRGWAQVVVLNPQDQEGPKIKKFNDGIKDITVCSVSYNGIMSRLQH